MKDTNNPTPNRKSRRPGRWALPIAAIALAVVAAVWWWLGRETPKPVLKWRELPVNWEAIGTQLGFSVEPIALDGVTYALRNCTVIAITPYSGNTLGAVFRDLRISYSGRLVRMDGQGKATSPSDEVRVILLAAPKVEAIADSRFSLANLRVDHVSLLTDDDAAFRKALEAALAKHVERLSPPLRFTADGRLPDAETLVLAPGFSPQPTIRGIDIPVLTKKGGAQ